MDKQSKRELRRECFKKVLETYRQDLKDKPILATIYEKEIPIFSKAVVEQNNIPNYTSNQKIVEACVTIIDYRYEKVRKNGRVCGTYASRVIERFKHWVQMVFCEDELAELVDCFVSAKELTQEQLDKVGVLLHNIPQIRVHSDGNGFL